MSDILRRVRYLFAALLFAGLALTYFFAAPRPANNYMDLNTPYYAADYATTRTVAPATITVITYNIQYAEAIEAATAELAQIEQLHGLDIVLLQEMDAAGVDQIARALHLNYVYYPATIHPHNRKDFGNAVLARWPIRTSAKLILPHLSPATNIVRTATRAVVQIGMTGVVAYSTHTETILALPWQRQDQYAAIAGSIEPAATHVVVGGDFNSVLPGDIRALERAFDGVGMQRASAAAGPTLESYNMNFIADHLFVKGFAVDQTGALAGATASDHLPVWAQLTFVEP